MRSTLIAMLLSLGSVVAPAHGQESIKVENFKQPPPDSLATEIRRTLGPDGYRLIHQDGKPFAEIWLRKPIPASRKPEGPKGRIQFPFLNDGELLGVLHFVSDGHDYREQVISSGVYTMRYALQPANGDHLGVSTYRDYMLLSPSIIDRSIAAPKRKTLEERSSESAGTSHPAAFLLLTPPANTAISATSIIHDEEKNLWGVVLPLSLQTKTSDQATALGVLLIIIGAAAV